MEKVAILIDCWGDKDYETFAEEKKKPFKTIVNFLKKDIVDTVIIASYLTGEAIHPRLYNPWIQNTKEYFEENGLSWGKKVQRDSISFAYELTNDPSVGVRQTNPGLIREYKTWNKPILFLHQPWEIPMLDKIKEVFFFGFAWDICVKIRPLGYDFWFDKTNANLYFDPAGTNLADATNDIFEKYSSSKKYPELKTIRETE